MPSVRAEISYFIEIGSFHNVDLFQRGHYQIRYHLKAGNSICPVNTFGQSTVAIYPPVIFGENSTASIFSGCGNNNQPLPPKGCSTTVLIMYHKESASLNDAFEQQVQVNTDINHLEDIFRQTELLFCAELWFAEENESDISNENLELLSTRQKRIRMSPTRGLCHHFNVIFDFSHLCAVEFVVQGYLTSIMPGLYRSSSLSSNLQTLNAYENYAKLNWRDVIGNGPGVNENKRHYAVAIHRHLCQALLSARERMISFWHDVAIFLKNQFQPAAEVTDLRSILERITSHFQQLKTETEMAKQIARDVDELASGNTIIFRQICEFIHAYPKVVRHIKRKSHQIRMKRLAEAFLVQELQIPQILAIYDPAVNGHESMAAAIRQSAYFQRLPELPVSCRHFDGDASNIPIIFEDVYIPLTEAQRNGTARSASQNVISKVTPKSIPLNLESVSLHTESGNHLTSEVRLRPHSVLAAGSISSFDDPAIADLLSSNSTNSSSVLSRVRRRRGQRLVLHSPETLISSINADGIQLRRRSRLNRLYHNTVRSEIAEVTIGGSISNNSGEADVRLTGYRRIVDDTFEIEEMKEKSAKKLSTDHLVERDCCGKTLNRQKQQEDEFVDESQSTRFGNSTRKCVSMMSLRDEEISSKLIHRIHPQCHHQNLFHSSKHSMPSSSYSSRRIEHSISTPNLVLTALNSSLAMAASAENLTVERCSRCGLPDLSTVTATTTIVGGGKRRENGKSSKLVSSLSLPSLTSLDANTISVAMATSSLSDSAGIQSGRPTMRRLKQQWKHKALFSKKIGSKNPQNLSAHLYTEDLVKFGSLSDLITRSCHCEKSTVPTSTSRNCQTSASMDLSSLNNSAPSTPITDFGRGRRDLSAVNQPTLPSLSEDFRDPELLEESGSSCEGRLAHLRLKGSREPLRRSRETMEEFLISMGTGGEEDEGRVREDVEEIGMDVLVVDTTDGQSGEISSWVMKNPENSMAILQNKLSRRSLSQTFLASNGEREKCLAFKHQIADTKWVASSTECLSAKAPSTSTMTSSNNNLGGDRLVNAFAPGTMTFVMLKEHLKQNVLQGPTFKGHIYSDFSQLPVPFPYFSNPKVKSSAVHLVICVHGLEGSCLDLRLLTMYLQLALPDHPLEFLMSDSNHEDTFNSLEQLRDNLVKEILQHIESMPEKPTHISFIGHSLGCILVRAALSSPRLVHLYPLLHTFLSLCGPHLGTLYSTSGLVSAGMWALQKLKKSRSLLQLRLRDHPDPRETFMYNLSSAEGLDFFRHVLLVGSPQDHYVPHHSSRIELCKAAVQDPSEMGIIYMEMVANLLQRLIKSSRIRSVVRYDVHYETQASANHFIGRAAHIAVLDSDVFMEKFFCVSAAKFFRVHVDKDNDGKGSTAVTDGSVKSLREEHSASTHSSVISDVSLLANGN